MSLLSVLAQEAPATLVMPNWAFPLIAAAIFTTLGFITWSYRDVANRHTTKVDEHADHSDAGHGHH
ncbi:MAG: hypothetical protein HIU88_11720 [Acidobacteria bacterium]|nr:hypothetical protein [Acidobacteriota bacterium]